MTLADGWPLNTKQPAKNSVRYWRLTHVRAEAAAGQTPARRQPDRGPDASQTAGQTPA
jgi:hypothetical protein